MFNINLINASNFNSFLKSVVENSTIKMNPIKLKEDDISANPI